MNNDTPKTWGAGTRAPERRVGPMTRTHIVRYAGAGGDFNPIHHDETFAHSAGYPGVFAHGMLTAGILGGYIADWLGHAHLRKFALRYVAQVWPGDILLFNAHVTQAQETPQGLQLDCELTVQRQVDSSEPQLVLSGTTRAVIPQSQ